MNWSRTHDRWGHTVLIARGDCGRSRARVATAWVPRTGPTYTGHFTVWGNFNHNREGQPQENTNSSFTFDGHGTGSDGSTVSWHENAQSTCLPATSPEQCSTTSSATDPRLDRGQPHRAARDPRGGLRRTFCREAPSFSWFTTAIRDRPAVSLPHHPVKVAGCGIAPARSRTACRRGHAALADARDRRQPARAGRVAETALAQ
jgi:hypothetical protein